MAIENEINLPVKKYTDSAVFEEESKLLFEQHWWLIGTTSSVDQKGKYISARLGTATLFVLCNEQGELKGFHNICRHRAGPIVVDEQGTCPGKLLICQYHGWSYDFSGKLVNAHGLTQSIDPAKTQLKKVRVETWNQMVFVTLGDAAPSLLHWLGTVAERVETFLQSQNLTAQGVIKKNAHTNWKCYGDNACEGYHVGLVHKTLGQSASNEKIDLHCEPEGEYVYFDVTYEDSQKDQSRTGKGLWIYKFPGLLIHCSKYGMNAECVLPQSEKQINITRWFWNNQDALEADSIEVTDLIDSASDVMDEDIQICEQVFTNLESGYAEPGPLSKVNEPGTIFFQKLVSTTV
ncbi:MAG: Rieske 2Fe-2S domain-containing protein [Granulosicoccus sp.]|nr:Rieske 2Fe-2S domain-containing protein [Granulosicoccus sp.]